MNIRLITEPTSVNTETSQIPPLVDTLLTPADTLLTSANTLLTSANTLLTSANTLLTPPPTIAVKCGISVGQWQVRGKSKWYVRFPSETTGKPQRRCFDTEAAAGAFATELRGDNMTNRKRLALLPAARIDALAMIDAIAQERNIDLFRAIAFLKSENGVIKEVPSAQTVLDALLLEKEEAHKDEKYITNIRQSLKKFIKGRETMPVDKFTTADVSAFLNGKTAGYKKTLRPKLSMLFVHARRKGYRQDNPCDALPAISVRKGTVEVLKVAEAKICLEYFVKNPKGLAWFVLSAFAGLRPQNEACLTHWESVRVKEQAIIVEANVCKTGRRRVVYAPAMVFGWLKWAKENRGDLPVSYVEVSTIQRKLRTLLGWPEWKQDCTRHSAASYWLAMTNDVKLVSRSLGHSITVLESKYDARVMEKDGQDYYGLTVDKFVIK